MMTSKMQISNGKALNYTRATQRFKAFKYMSVKRFSKLTEYCQFYGTYYTFMRLSVKKKFKEKWIF